MQIRSLSIHDFNHTDTITRVNSDPKVSHPISQNTASASPDGCTTHDSYTHSLLAHRKEKRIDTLYTQLAGVSLNIFSFLPLLPGPFVSTVFLLRSVVFTVAELIK